MNDTIQSILADLYELDPGLKEQEAGLTKLIEKLLEAKPDIQLDESFVESLRNELRVRNAKLAEEAPHSPLPTQRWLLRLAYGLGGVAVTAVIVIGVMNFSPFNRQPAPMMVVDEKDGGSGAFFLNEAVEMAEETPQVVTEAMDNPSEAPSKTALPKIPTPTSKRGEESDEEALAPQPLTEGVPETVESALPPTLSTATAPVMLDTTEMDSGTPSDTEFIKIANAYLKEQSIFAGEYSEPIVIRDEESSIVTVFYGDKVKINEEEEEEEEEEDIRLSGLSIQIDAETMEVVEGTKSS